MKIRTSFVTNSSSSSFVVAFKKKPESIEETKQMLFGNRELFYLDTWADRLYTTMDAAEQVYKDIQSFDDSNMENVFREINNSVKNGWFEGRPDPHFEELQSIWAIEDPEKQRAARDAYDRRSDDAADDIVSRFIAENIGSYFLVTSYSDNNGSFFSAMEHQGVFSNLPHIQTSYH